MCISRCLQKNLSFGRICASLKKVRSYAFFFKKHKSGRAARSFRKERRYPMDENDQDEQRHGSDYQRFKRLWRNERCSPVLLPHQEDLVQSVKFDIAAQVCRP